ncbi:MAG: phage holin family protein [Pseudomonadota bacterium]
MFGIKTSAKQAAHAAGVRAAGGVLCLIGAGFLIAAAYVALQAAFDALTAALILGGGFAGVGLIILAVAPRWSPQAAKAPAPQPAQAQPESSMPAGLAVAFLDGFEEGARTRTHVNRTH